MDDIEYGKIDADEAERKLAQGLWKVVKDSEVDMISGMAILAHLAGMLAPAIHIEDGASIEALVDIAADNFKEGCDSAIAQMQASIKPQ